MSQSALISTFRMVPVKLLGKYGRWRANRELASFDYRSANRHQEGHGGQTGNGVVLVPWIHPGARLGHQLASWISAHLWAIELGICLRQVELTSDTEGLFRLPGTQVRSRKVRLLPLRAVPDERNARSHSALTTQLVARHLQSGDAIRLSFDQFRWNQVPAAAVLRGALRAGRRGPEILDHPDRRIGIHIRRGDVAGDSTRSLTVAWYEKVYESMLSQAAYLGDWPVHVYSEPGVERFDELRRRGWHIHSSQSWADDFIELVNCGVLVTSRSSFSFSAALCGLGVAVCPVPWWHAVPSEGRFVHAFTDGHKSGLVDSGRFVRALSEQLRHLK